MTGWKDMGTGLRALLLGGGAAAAATVGAVIWRASEGPATAPVESVVTGVQAPAAPEPPSQPPAPTDAVAAPSAEAPAPTSKPASPEPAAEQDQVASVEPAAEEPAAEPGAAASPSVEAAASSAVAPTPAAKAPDPILQKAPGFDVVRVSPDGAAVIAGTAEAGSHVSLRVDGTEVAKAETDATGSFVSLFTLEPSDEARVVTLLATLDDGREVPSAASVLIAPTRAPVAVADANPEPAPPTGEAATAEPVTPAPEPEKTAEEVAPAAAPAPAAEPVAPAAVLLTAEGAKVLQPTTEADPAIARNVTIDTISYSKKGDVQLAGRAAIGGVVRLYVDNAAVLEAQIAKDGTWSGTLPAVDAGVYTLRADQVNAEGRVLSRYETPFQREAPDLLATAAAGQVASKITVQPGFTLWGIARESYGDGVMYVRLYDANKAQIRDPDLIYPGQVFTIPTKD